MADVVIRADQLGKCYHLYSKPMDRIKQAFCGGKKRFFEEFWALREISFDIGRGETVGVIGANGSGKSTLLQMVSGILTPTVGRLTVQGRVTALLELGAGFNPEFTGRDNVFMNAAIMGISSRETEARFKDIADFADIGSFIDKPVKTYSSGMYVRLAFSTMVNVSPEILLVDEALSVGDIRFQQKCMARIKAFCKTGTVLFVTHDLSAVTELCTRAIWIDSGTLRLDGAPKHIVNRYLQFMYEGNSPPANRTAEESTDTATNLSTDLVAGLPNDALELGDFLPIASNSGQFGDHRVTIDAIRLSGAQGENGIAYSEAGFDIGLIAHAHQTIANPIVGFILKDRLGRQIIGDNTALMRRRLEPFHEHHRYAVFFRFKRWPNLLEGEYTLSLAVADGTLENHSLCHWYHDVAIITSIPVQKPAGLFSLPDTGFEVLSL